MKREYNTDRILEILENYGDLKEPTPGHLIETMDWKKVTLNHDGKFVYGIVATSDVDEALDKIGDKKGAWFSFVADYETNMSTHYPGSLVGLNSLQCAAAGVIRNGGSNKPGSAQARGEHVVARQIANILNSPYYKDRLGKKNIPGVKTMEADLKRFEVQLAADTREKLRNVIGRNTEGKIVRQLVEALAGMDPESFEIAQRISNIEGVPLSVLVRNSLMAWLIRVDEHIILYGLPDRKDLLVFAKDDSADFESIYRPVCRRDLEMAACQSIIDQERYGIPLEDWEKDLLIKHKQGRAWLESDEYKAGAEQRKASKQYARERKLCKTDDDVKALQLKHLNEFK